MWSNTEVKALISINFGEMKAYRGNLMGPVETEVFIIQYQRNSRRVVSTETGKSASQKLKT